MYWAIPKCHAGYKGEKNAFAFRDLWSDEREEKKEPNNYIIA